jgi:hypothetical protein
VHHLAAVVVDLPFDAFEVVVLLLIGGLFVTIGRTGCHSDHKCNHDDHDEMAVLHVLPPFASEGLEFWSPAAEVLIGKASH